MSASTSISPSALDRENPWPGLAPFTEAQSAQFFGRDAEIKTLSRRVQGDPLTVLFGQSGLGKSSLLQAGVFPRLRSADYCPIYLRLDHAPGAPSLGEQVKQTVLAATARAGSWTKAGVARPGESLWEFFHHRDNRLVSPGGIALSPVLVFDQFEELFTLGAQTRNSDLGGRRSVGAGEVGAEDSAATERSPPSGGGESGRQRAVAFMTELAELVENRPPDALVARVEASPAELDALDFGATDYRVVITLREDYLPHLESLKAIMPTLMDNRMRLSRMNGVQALEAVVKPGAGLVTEEVARAIVEFVAGARGGSVERLAELDVEPPLLSIICRELNERRRALGQAQITADLVSGNRREILTNFYERSVADLPEAMRTFVEDHLLTKSGFRDNLSLESALDFPGVTRPLIDTLVNRRLLRIEDRLGVERVELTHDVLAEVIRAARDARQQRIAEEEAEALRRLDLAAAARRTRHLRWALAGAVVAVIGLSIGAVFGVRAQHRAAAQLARADLATGSRLLDEGKVGDGLAYLVSAARRGQDSSVAATRIMTALAARTFFLPVGPALMLPSPAGATALLADGRSALVVSEDGRVRLIDVIEGKIEREFAFEHEVHANGLRTAAKNSDVFAVAFVNGTVVVCDTATGRPRFAPIIPQPRVAALAPLRVAGSRRAWWPDFSFSPDGRWLVAHYESWTIFDASTGQERSGGELLERRDFREERRTTFSPDSTRLATSSAEPYNVAVTGYNSRNFTLEVRSVPDGKVIAKLAEGAPDYCSALHFSADGKRLLVTAWVNARGGSVRSASVYDAEKLVPVGPPVLFGTEEPNDLWLTPDGTRVVATSNDRTAKVFEVATGKLAFPALAHGGPVRFVGLSDESTTLATISLDGQCRLWNLQAGTLAASTVKWDRGFGASLARDGRTLVVTSASGALHRLKVTAGPAVPLTLPLGSRSFMAAPFSSQLPARLLWPLQSPGLEMFAIDIATGRRTTERFGFTAGVLRFDARADNHTFRPETVMVTIPYVRPQREAVTRSEDGVLSKVILADAIPARSRMTISSSGNLGVALFTPTGETSPSFGIWNLRTGQRVGKIPAAGLTAAAGTADFSPDDGRVAILETGVAGRIRVYRIIDAKLLCILGTEGKEAFRVGRFSPDGTRLLTGNAWGTVQVWDGTTGKLLQSTQAHTFNVTGIVVSADGRLYASHAADGTVQVWNSATQQPVGAPLVLGGAVGGVALSADNARVVTAAAHGVTQVWDIASGLPLGDPLYSREAAVAMAAFSPDERFVTTAAGIGTPTGAQHVWATPPVVRAGPTPRWLLQLATICAGRRLTDEGKLVSAVDEFDRLDALRREIAALPASDALAEQARWFLSDQSTRAIAPGFMITPTEAKKLEEEFTLIDDLSAAIAALGPNRFAESEVLERKRLALVRVRDAGSSDFLGTSLRVFGDTLLKLGKFEEAEAVAREGIEIRTKILPTVNASWAYATVALAVAGQQRYGEAEPLLVNSYATLSRPSSPGADDGARLRRQWVAEALEKLYTATNEPEKAAEWKLKAAEARAP